MRKTLTEWPKADEPAPKGRYALLSPYVGEFYLRDGEMVFRDTEGLLWHAHEFDRDDTFVPVPDPRDARLAALEAENAGLKARVAELEASIEREAAYRREQQERQDRLAGIP